VSGAPVRARGFRYKVALSARGVQVRPARLRAVFGSRAVTVGRQLKTCGLCSAAASELKSKLRTNEVGWWAGGGIGWWSLASGALWLFCLSRYLIT
jgi:hypothetical protein